MMLLSTFVQTPPISRRKETMASDHSQTVVTRTGSPHRTSLKRQEPVTAAPFWRHSTYDELSLSEPVKLREKSSEIGLVDKPVSEWRHTSYEGYGKDLPVLMIRAGSRKQLNQLKPVLKPVYEEEDQVSRRKRDFPCYLLQTGCYRWVGR